MVVDGELGEVVKDGSTAVGRIKVGLWLSVGLTRLEGARVSRISASEISFGFRGEGLL